MAVDPSVGLPALLAKQEAEAAEKRARVEQGRVAIEEWLRSYVASDDGHAYDVRRLHGVEAVREALERLAAECAHEVWSLNPGGGHQREALLRSRPLEEATLARGVRIRAVFLDSLRNHEPTVEHAEWLADRGGEVRTVSVLPMRMVLVDRRTALVPLDVEDSSKGALLVNGDGLVQGLTALYRTIWRSARPLGEGRPTRIDGAVSLQETQALALWAGGATDALVAKRLGVSERTVRRMSDALARRSGSRSRFELGARALSLGWVSEADLD